MVKLESRDLIEEYYNSIKDQYPGLTLEQCKEIVSTPFKMVKESMETEELPTIRLKYLGTFVVYPGRALGALKLLTNRFKLHKIDRAEYFRIKAMVDNFLKREHNEIED